MTLQPPRRGQNIAEPKAGPGGQAHRQPSSGCKAVTLYNLSSFHYKVILKFTP